MIFPVGIDDFAKIRNLKLNFVDKSLFVKEVLDDKGTEVAVITRPRRFGKTCNLSMLYYFLSIASNIRDSKNLFTNLKIASINNGAYFAHQGQYPVIFITFKNIKEDNFQDAFTKLIILMRELYGQHRYLGNSEELAQDERDIYQKYLLGNINQPELENGLYKLSALLSKHYQKKVWILIDEYDTPIQAGYLKGYYDEIIKFMRGLFGTALKTNIHLDRSVITGILRVAKESIFSDINNLKVYSLLDAKYSQYFGFTEAEVSDILKTTNLTHKEEDVKKWYNGYIFGGTIVYNPWSIVNFISENGLLNPYWANTSGNDLIRSLLAKSDIKFKAEFDTLLQNGSVNHKINENMVFGDLSSDQGAAWSLLLMSGYLKAVKIDNSKGLYKNCKLSIPNWEIKAIYCDIIEKWLGSGRGAEWFQDFLEYLLNGDIESFKENFGVVLAQTLSVFDPAKEPEAFYHGFMLGLTAGLDKDQYEVRSNRESGKGRYDIAIIPRDIKKLAIIFEIKNVPIPPNLSNKKRNEFLDKDLNKAAQAALNQINDNKYILELVQRGLNNFIKIGLAFCGKEFRLQSEGAQNKSS